MPGARGLPAVLGQGPAAGRAHSRGIRFCRRGDESRPRDLHAPPGDTPDRVDRMKRAKYDRLRGTHRLWNAANPVVAVGPQPLRSPGALMRAVPGTDRGRPTQTPDI